MSTKSYAAKHKELGLCRNCPSPVIDGSTLFCEYHRNKDRLRRRIAEKKFALALKHECLEFYGGECNCCGERAIQFLTIDHLEGKGNIHRKLLFKHNVGGVHMYRWLKKNNYPDGYAVLCMNCNWATRNGESCPHQNGEVA